MLAHTADNAGWHAVVRVPGSPPVVYTAVTQPDPLHRSIVVGVALVRSSAVQAHLESGTVQPVRSESPGQIPPGQLPDVAAAFNSGFKMSSYSGGFFLDGATVRTLVDGKASAVIDDTGRLSVGQWGRDIQMSSHVRAVRQNLALIVEGGQPVPGLDRNADLRWGTPSNQLQYTWRSAMGITRSGDVVYVAGDKLNLATLGVALARAGSVTGMELDIHSGMEFFSSWRYDGAGGSKPQRLMPCHGGSGGPLCAPRPAGLLLLHDHGLDASSVTGDSPSVAAGDATGDDSCSSGRLHDVFSIRLNANGLRHYLNVVRPS